MESEQEDGQLSWLEEQFRKRGPIDIPSSFILQSYHLDSEQSPTSERHSLFEWDMYCVSDLPMS